jgi:hypothetical protein
MTLVCFYLSPPTQENVPATHCPSAFGSSLLERQSGGVSTLLKLAKTSSSQVVVARDARTPLKESYPTAHIRVKLQES